MHLWRTTDGIIVNDGARTRIFPADWDALINHEDLAAYLASSIPGERTRRPFVGFGVSRPIGP